MPVRGAGGGTWNTVSRMPESPAPATITTSATTARLAIAPESGRSTAAEGGAPGSGSVTGDDARSAKAKKTTTPRK